MDIYSSLSQIFGIGPVFQKKLKKLGLKTVRDLFYHFPHRYEDFSNIIPIKDLKLNQVACIQGKILEINSSQAWRRRLTITQAIIQDETAAIKATWFNHPYLAKNLKEGDNVFLAGKIILGEKGVYISNPAYEKIDAEQPASNLTHTGRLVPVYPETDGLSSRWLRTILKNLLSNFQNRIPESLPKDLIEKYGLAPLNKALWQIHFPKTLQETEAAKERFAFEEIFSIQLSVLKERIKLSKTDSPPIAPNIELIKKFVGSLPFKLTDAQRKCAWQILKDMEKSHPMNRLLEGDVGSGKTIVAAIAVLNCAKAGYQTAIMAPTEILVKQHFKEFSKILFPFKLKIALLTGKEDQVNSIKLKNETIEISRRKILEKTLLGEIHILIGTHALISSSKKEALKKGGEEQNKIIFQKLGLVVVDEQHRFGVEQRARLCKGYGGQAPNGPATAGPTGQAKLIPHLLSMTATPIPRTLALTIYGDLDLSIIDELPQGRKKILTEIVPPTGRQKIYDFIKSQIEEGRQAFVICPRIEASKNSERGDLSWADVKAVKEEYEKLSKEIFPDLKIGMLHGKLSVKEKERIMRDFKFQKIDILVSTSVVEVGIDMPNATVIAIEGAERFGLSQLHQFRGRVGRSIYQSYCFLFTNSPAVKTNLRLKALVKAQDGFELSKKDLEIRGPGQLSGNKQWGIPDLAMSSLQNMPLVEKTRQAAKEILEKDYTLEKHPMLLQKLQEFKKRIHLE